MEGILIGLVLTRLAEGLIDIARSAVNDCGVELEDAPKRPDDALAALLRQDLDPLSLGDLEARITALEGEIARTKRKIGVAVHHRASADQLFRR